MKEDEGNNVEGRKLKIERINSSSWRKTVEVRKMKEGRKEGRKVEEGKLKEEK